MKHIQAESTGFARCIPSYSGNDPGLLAITPSFLYHVSISNKEKSVHFGRLMGRGYQQNYGDHTIVSGLNAAQANQKCSADTI
jgi:hypothetical protein